MIDKDAKIYVAGHEEMIGSALIRYLRMLGFDNLITKSSTQLNLTNQKEVSEFFTQEDPDYVFLTTAEEGGILANITYPASLIYKNLQIEANLIHFAKESNIEKLLFLGSSCVYPKFCHQPMKENALLTGSIEPTNEAYAIAKIAGIKMCQAYNQEYGTNFISVIPTNIYGPGDNFDLKISHVIPALINKFYEAKFRRKENVTIWGTGTPRREFLYIDDFVGACLFLMDKYNGSEVINIGYGKDISINELAFMIKDIAEFDGKLIFDTTKPDGMPNKLLDISKICEIGWRPKIDLKNGLRRTYEWFEGRFKNANSRII